MTGMSGEGQLFQASQVGEGQEGSGNPVGMGKVCSLIVSRSMSLLGAVFYALIQGQLTLAFILPDIPEGDPCEASGGVPGYCTRVGECEGAKNRKRGIGNLCSFIKREPVVCCPVTTSEKIRIAKDKIKLYCLQAEKECVERRTLYMQNENNEINRHVIGGVEAPWMSHVHMAAIGYGPADDKTWNCGGSLINHRYVLSAAHCVTQPVQGGPQWVRLGDLNLADDSDDDHVQEREIVETILHPDYRSSELYNDIVLFKLDRPVEFTPWVGPACLNVEQVFEASRAQLSGWGRTGLAEAQSDKLLEADLDIFNDTDCKRFYPSMKNKTPRGIDSESMFCAGTRDGSKGACLGDSGGPVVLDEKLKCLKTQIGILSFGNDCGLPDSPDVSTRVSNYISWIEDFAFSQHALEGLVFS